MKKTVAILTALFILIAGMHLSVATHLCGGEVAEVKWSFSGETGGCGMERGRDVDTSTHITSDCCHDHVASFTVDNQYKTPTNQISQTVGEFAHSSLLPASYLRFPVEPFSSIAKLPSSLDIGQIVDVDLAHICTLRI